MNSKKNKKIDELESGDILLFTSGQNIAEIIEILSFPIPSFSVRAKRLLKSNSWQATYIVIPAHIFDRDHYKVISDKNQKSLIKVLYESAG